MATIQEIKDLKAEGHLVALSDQIKYKKHIQNKENEYKKRKETYKQMTFKIVKTEENLRLIKKANELADESGLTRGEFFINQLANNNTDSIKLIKQKVWASLSKSTRSSYKENHNNLDLVELITYLEGK